MDAPPLPALDVARPALALVEQVGYGQTGLSFNELQRTADKPRTTVTRYLQQLTDARIILRIRHDEYAIPTRATFGRLLVEPDAYARSVLLHADILDAHEATPWAFACLPIRGVYDVEIDRAIPVLLPDGRLQDGSGAPPYPDALWYAFDPHDIDRRPYAPHDAPGPRGDVPTLPARTALALLTASLDPRHVRAARNAARRLGLPYEPIVRQAKGLAPTRTPLKALRPNTVVFPRWLETFWETAKTQHAQHALDRLVDEQGTRKGTTHA